MPKIPEAQHAKEIATFAERTNIPISDTHARLAAKSSDSLHVAYDVIRAIEYKDHEPSNIFQPVVWNDDSDKGSDQ